MGHEILTADQVKIVDKLIADQSPEELRWKIGIVDALLSMLEMPIPIGADYQIRDNQILLGKAKEDDDDDIDITHIITVSDGRPIDLIIDEVPGSPKTTPEDLEALPIITEESNEVESELITEEENGTESEQI